MFSVQAGHESREAKAQVLQDHGSSGKTLANFTDADEISIWAKEAITLFVETGTIVGNNEKLSPSDKATRAEMAQVMYNLLSK